MDLSMLSRDRAGQVIEPDFLASILVFSVIIGSFIVTWNTVTSSSTMFDVEEEMREDAKRTANFMVSTPGYPNDWEETGEVQIAGFAEEQSVLDIDKLDAFDEISYDNQSRALKVRNFRLEFRDEDGDILEQDGEQLAYGEMYGEDARVVVPVKRSVLLNDSGSLKSAEMRFLVWRE